MGKSPADGAGGASKAPAEIPKNLPFKQRIALEYAPKLESLVKKFGHVSYKLEDQTLATNISYVFEKIGFACHPQPDQQARVLVMNVVKWLDKGHLVLLHFKPKSTDFNLVHLLREIKLAAPGCRLEGLVPIFVGAVTSQKQMEIFKLLGAFGILYASFLTLEGPTDKNIEELLSDLGKYADLLKSDTARIKGVIDTGEEDPAKVKKYRELMAKGKQLMDEHKYEEAINSFSEAIILGPNFKLLMERGEAYYQSRQYIPALNDFREAAKLEKAVPDPYAKIGACCLSMVKNAALAEGAEKARKWFSMGMKYLKDAEGIVVKMEKGNERYPERLPLIPYAPILNAIAELDIRGLGFPDMEKQMASFGAEVLGKLDLQDGVISDNSVDTRIDRAILLTRYKNYDEAEKLFRGLVTEDPENVGPAFNNFAVELRKNEQYAKAFEIYQELLKFSLPDRDIVVENMKTAGLKHASDLKEKMKYGESVAALRNILIHKPKHREWVLCELAVTFLEMQDQAQASFSLMEALYVNPKLMQSERFAPYKDLGNLRQEMMKKLLESEPGKQIR